MSLTIKRKQIVAVSLAVALAAAMFVNWYYTRPIASAENEPELTSSTQRSDNLGDAHYVNASGVTDEYFSQAQLNRAKAQEESKQTLMTVIESSQADEESKKTANEALEKLSQSIALESEIESLIKAKTGGNVFVTLGESAEIVLQKGTLNSEVCVQIKDIINNKTEIPLEKITIIEAK